MLTTMFYIYLAGWIGTSTYGVATCEPSLVISSGECRAIMVVAGAAWPAMAYQAAKEKLEEK